MWNRLLIGALAASACGTQPAAVHAPQTADHANPAAEPRPMVIETKADPAAESYSCGDTVLADQAMTGGERLSTILPCWDREEEAAAHERFERNRTLDEAKREQLAHPDQPAAVATKVTACQRIPARELEHSPFAHRKEIVSVTPYRENGEVRGALIVFKPVRGLTAEWMRTAIACHQAQFASLGAGQLSNDPTVVEGATVTVTERDHHVEVLVVGGSHEAGLLALDRARDGGRKSK